MRRKQQTHNRELNMSFMRSGIIAVLAVLVGCAPVGPEFTRPDVPAHPAWLAADLQQFDTDAAELAQWWQQLADPVLDRLIVAAHEQNNNVKLAGLRVLEAQASLGIATGARFPQTQVLSGNATAVGASESNANTGAGDLSFTQYGLAAGFSWEIDFWGRFRRGIEAADANLLASIASFDEMMVLLTAQVADTYMVIRSTEEQLRLARENQVLQQRSFDIVEVLYRNGASSELDALQAKTLLLSTEAAIPGLDTALRQAKNALSVLLGLPPSDIDELLEGEGRLPNLPDTLRIGAPADLVRQRPDVRRAELQALAQNAAVGIAEADLYPSFSLSGSLGFAAAGNTDTTRTGESGLGELFRAESLTYSVGPSFVWPFLNYGRIRNNIRVQDARLQQALIQYREVVIQAALEVENSMAALNGAQAQDEILAETVEVAKRSAELSLVRYKEGFADYQRVLDAQQALFAQQQRYASNRGNVVRNFIAIYRSLGGGWQFSQPRQYVDEEARQQMESRSNWGDLLDNPPQLNE